VRLHAAPLLPRNSVVIFEDAVEVLRGLLSALEFDADDDDGCFDVFLNPEDVAVFEARFPSIKFRRPN
jgi:hypothetical protein